MKQGKTAHADFRTFFQLWVPAHTLLDVHGDIAVRQHCTLGYTRGTAGVLQHRQVIHGDLYRRHGRRRSPDQSPKPVDRV